MSTRLKTCSLSPMPLCGNKLLLLQVGHVETVTGLSIQMQLRGQSPALGPCGFRGREVGSAVSGFETCVQ